MHFLSYAYTCRLLDFFLYSEWRGTNCSENININKVSVLAFERLKIMENDKPSSQTVRVAVAYERWSFTVRGSYYTPLTGRLQKVVAHGG